MDATSILTAQKRKQAEKMNRSQVTRAVGFELLCPIQGSGSEFLCDGPSIYSSQQPSLRLTDEKTGVNDSTAQNRRRSSQGFTGLSSDWNDSPARGLQPLQDRTWVREQEEEKEGTRGSSLGLENNRIKEQQG